MPVPAPDETSMAAGSEEQEEDAGAGVIVVGGGEGGDILGEGGEILNEAGVGLRESVVGINEAGNGGLVSGGSCGQGVKVGVKAGAGGCGGVVGGGHARHIPVDRGGTGGEELALVGHGGCSVVEPPCRPCFVGTWKGFPFVGGTGEMVGGKDGS